MYSAIAKSYNELYGEEQKKKADLILQNIELTKNIFLLDVGCGTGISTKLFKCKKIGIDPEFELLKQADFPVVCGVAERLPFKNKTFDIVISLTAIHNFKDFSTALKEIKNIAKKELVVSILKKSKYLNQIILNVKKLFKIKKVLEEEKDIILFSIY